MKSGLIKRATAPAGWGGCGIGMRTIELPLSLSNVGLDGIRTPIIAGIKEIVKLSLTKWSWWELNPHWTNANSVLFPSTSPTHNCSMFGRDSSIFNASAQEKA